MESQEAPSRSPDEPTTRRKPSYFPGPRVWVVGLLCGIGIAVVRNLEIDLALMNIVTIMLLGLGLMIFLTWWCFGSSYPPSIRWLPPVLLLVAASAFSVKYRPYRSSGALIPQFVIRGAPVHDELLQAIPAADSSILVDLATTGPDDFPGFLGPQRNSVLIGIEIKPDWDARPPRQLWQREIGAGWSGFACVNGFAVTMEQRGESELVTCYAVETGQPCWSHAIETRHETFFGSVGPRATPTIAGGKVFAMGATGVLRCLAGADGSEIWVRDLFADYGLSQTDGELAVAWGRANSPLVVGERVYVPIGGKRDQKCVSLLALDAATGETIWEAGEHQASYASPVLATLGGVEQILMVNENFVTGHELASGRVLWEHPWEGRSDLDANVSQPIAVDEERVFLSKGYGIGAELIQVTPADPLWDVELLWEARVLKTKFSNAAIHEGYVYALDDGILSCVDLETGERQWKKGRYNYGQILLVGNTILVLSEDGEMVLVEATPAGLKELGSFQALEGQTWNTICLSGKYLLVRNAEQAACYEIDVERQDVASPRDVNAEVDAS